MKHATTALKFPNDEAEALVSLVKETFNRLAAQTDLSPKNPVVNETLSTYVDAIIRADECIMEKESVLNDPEVAGLRDGMMALLSRAEFEMEDHFAKLLSQGGKMPLSGLNRFWYRANYQALVENEVAGIKAFANDAADDRRAMAFVGSGPLPLSAVDYYLLTGKPCVCIELNAEAARDSRRLIDNIGLSDVIEIVEQDGREADYSPYGMIFVAALVDNKEQVLDRIHETANKAMIGVRSADGLKQLLYTQVDTAKIEERGFTHCGTTYGTPSAVNSTCFFRMR